MPDDDLESLFGPGRGSDLRPATPRGAHENVTSRSSTALSTGPGTPAAITAESGGVSSALEGVKEFPSRVKCATLAWHALNSALSSGNEDAKRVSTE